LGADQLDAVLLQHAVVGQVQRAVQRGLPAHRRQQRVGFLLGDDLLDRLPVDRLDVDSVGHLRVGHDRGRVGVDQHHAVALLAQRLAGLRAGVVELAGLADDDRAGTDDEDGLEVAAPWHQLFSIAAMNRSNNGATSCGPGLASGCPWKLNAGASARAMPWLLPSNSERWVTRALAGSVASSIAKPWFCEVIITRPLST